MVSTSHPRSRERRFAVPSAEAVQRSRSSSKWSAFTEVSCWRIGFSGCISVADERSAFKDQRRISGEEEAAKIVTDASSLLILSSSSLSSGGDVAGSSARERIPRVCDPLSVNSLLPVEAFQIMMAASALPERRMGVLFRLRVSTVFTKSVWPRKRRVAAPVDVDQDQIVLSQLPE